CQLKRMSNGFISILFTLFIINQFISSTIMIGIYTVMTAIIIVISLSYSKGLPKYFGVIMTVISAIILIYSRQPLDVWMEGITKNLPLVCLIVVVPLLGIPISLGKYHEHLADLTAKFQTKPHILYIMVSGLFTLIAPITNIGSIYIVHSMIEKLKLPSAFLGR